ncbi:hypothetical protein [Amycolatopsis sp. NPDC051716]|uniref:hypothetical protein n=1 Tax=Amycolatopsis sp. NPDC051716 TaxID=3155804 RepID=UPI00342B8FF5
MNTEQENRLREDLRRAVDGETFRTDPDVVLGRARRARRRTLVARGAAGTGVLAVVAATLIAGHPGDAPEVRTAAYVVERVSAALDGGPGYVYRIVDHDEGTVWYQDQVTMSQYWVYGTGGTRIEAWDSSPVIDHAAHLLDTTVNHQDRTYSTEDTKLPGHVAGELPPKTNFVDRIKRSISGQEIVGSGEYQGHRVLKLGYAAGELWVDATTYLPVYRITTDADGRRTTSDLAFLPRTPDLVQTVNTPRVPAGFTKVAEANTGPGHGG